MGMFNLQDQIGNAPDLFHKKETKKTKETLSRSSVIVSKRQYTDLMVILAEERTDFSKFILEEVKKISVKTFTAQALKEMEEQRRKDKISLIPTTLMFIRLGKEDTQKINDICEKLSITKSDVFRFLVYKKIKEKI